MHVAVHAEAHHRLGGVEGAVDVVKARAGGACDPAIAERFTSAAKGVLEVLDAPSPWACVLDAEPSPHRITDDAGLDAAASVLGDISEAAPWVKGHGRRVAQLSEGAAVRSELDASEATALRRAAHLHDLGSITVGLPTWNRPGPLSDMEWEQVRLHSYHTERIVTRTSSLRRAGEIAGLHHERLDGTGYHRGTGGAAIPLAARLLAAADVFDALLHARPHRSALPLDQAAHQLELCAREGVLDERAVHAVLEAADAPRSAPSLTPAGLTAREVEVLRAVARGMSIKQAALALEVRPKTIDNHLQRIYPKLGVSTRAAATLRAVELGLLE